MAGKVSIRQMTTEDYPEVRNIYQLGIDTGNATFDVLAPDWEQWDARFLTPFRLVAEREGKVVAWAGLSATSSRHCYAGVCEVSVYVHPGQQRQGIGKSLLKLLISISEENNVWTLQAGIFPENIISVKIHKELGFREVGVREKIGKMDGEWRDVILLERRSRKVGVK